MRLLEIMVLYKGPKRKHVKVYNGLIIKALWLDDQMKHKLHNLLLVETFIQQEYTFTV